jgi:hypothetical protein
MRLNQTLREKIDDIMWLLTLGDRGACEHAVHHIKHFRADHGSGWWDDTLDRAEKHARKTIENLTLVSEFSRVKNTYA